MTLLDDRRKWTLLLFFFVVDLCFCHRTVWPVAGSLRIDSGAGHQFLDGVNRFRSVVGRLMVFAAHDDGFFRASVHAESTIDAAHHVDIEALWKLFDLRIRVFSG